MQLRTVETIEPGDLLLEPALVDATRVLWRHTTPAQVTLLLDTAPPTTTSHQVGAHLPVVCRDELAHPDRDAERVTRVRCAARGAAWMRTTRHPHQPALDVLTMLVAALAALTGTSAEHTWSQATATL